MSSVSVSSSAMDDAGAAMIGLHIERINLIGSSAIDARGNALGNTITGNAQANSISGGLGNDTLTGGGGADHFVFDTTLAANNIDSITDFDEAADIIVMNSNVFNNLTAAGPLTAGQLVVGQIALDADDYVLFDTTSGAISYDQDGNGAAVAIQFAVLTGFTGTLSETNFLVV
jgi:Ca2+-binding RTX toxin-like protein